MKSEEQFELIKKGVLEWNKWRTNHPDTKINLAKYDFSYFDFSGFDLSGADLFQTDFTGANLSFARLYKADLTEANLTNTNCTNAVFSAADLSKVKIKGANLSEALFNSAKLYYIDFENVIFAGTFFKNSKFWNAKFRGVKLFAVSFYQADLHGSDFTGSNLWKAYFIETNLYQANFSNTYISEPANTKDYKLDSYYRNSIVNFNKANLAGVNFSKSDLSGGAAFTDANLNSAQFIEANFSGAFFYNAKLENANLTRANFSKANFTNSYLRNANLTKTNLKKAILCSADLAKANLTGANLSHSDLSSTFLSYSNMSNANLRGANLTGAQLVEVNIHKSIFTNCKVYGISSWGLKGIPKEQNNIIITPEDESIITVDDLQVAQFIYLLLNRENLRNILNAISSKSVLILGRFTIERKNVLEAMAKELRKHNLLPIIFDFQRPTSRDFTETIKTLAGISLFVIIDITNPRSSPLELQATVPDYQIPFIPIIQDGEKPFSMISDLIGKYDWMLDTVLTYSSIDDLIYNFKEAIIDTAWNKHKELLAKKAVTLKTQSISDYAKKTNKLN